VSFPTTNWTLLAAATLDGNTQGRAALEALCRDYRRPVHAVLSARGFAAQEAEDLTQEFFLSLFETRAWKRADRDRGRFRSFLLGALAHMLDHVWRARFAQKRGGGESPVSLDAAADAGFEIAAPETMRSDVFDREWALGLIQAAFAEVEREFAGAARVEEFAVLRRFLPGIEAPLRYDEAARLLGKSEGVVKSLVHRLRTRFREAVRRSVARTVAAAHEVEEELAYLHAVLAAPAPEASNTSSATPRQ
jgi:RNA polymerase sigma-70 factor (ECF subfamily)